MDPSNVSIRDNPTPQYIIDKLEYTCECGNLEDISIKKLKSICNQNNIDYSHFIEKNEFIDAIYKKKSTSSNTCNICLCDYIEGDTSTHLPCGHKFHKECILPWLKKNNKCPICREQLK